MHDFYYPPEICLDPKLVERLIQDVVQINCK